MNDLDVSVGLKEDLHRELIASLGNGENEIVKDFAPNDITLYQRTNGRGMLWHDAMYLWLRLHRKTGKKDFDSTKHQYSRCTIVREDAVLESINRLDKNKRLRLLSLAERDFVMQHRPTQSQSKTQQVLEDIQWHRFQTFKDLLIRGQLEIDDVFIRHQTLGGICSANDLEAFAAILGCNASNTGSDASAEFGDGEPQEEFDVFQAFNEPREGEEDATETWDEQGLEKCGKDRLRELVLDSWRRTTCDEETALLAEHDSDRTDVELKPCLNWRLLPRLDMGVTLESFSQKIFESEHLFTHDDHLAQTKYNKSGRAFGEKVICNVNHTDRAKLIDSIAEHFRGECQWECERFYHQAPILRSHPWARAIALPFLNRLQAVLLKAGEEVVTRLRNNDPRDT